MSFSLSRESLEFHKLILLYMLNRVDFPLPLLQILDFLLERDYSSYLTLQQAVSQLEEAGLIATASSVGRTTLAITGEGQKTLDFFRNRIDRSIQQDIDSFLKGNEFTLRSRAAVSANYYKAIGGEYEALLTAKDKDAVLLEIRLLVPTDKLAEAVCENWKKKNQEIYGELTRLLF